MIIFIDLEEPPRNITCLLLNIAWIIQQVTQPGQSLPLHYPDDFR